MTTIKMTIMITIMITIMTHDYYHDYQNDSKRLFFANQLVYLILQTFPNDMMLTLHVVSSQVLSLPFPIAYAALVGP